MRESMPMLRNLDSHFHGNDTKCVSPNNTSMKFRQSLFWDTNPEWIDTEKNARYIIERILEFGRIDEVSWLFQQYPKDTIKEVMNLPRVQLSPKSKNLWSLVLQ